MYTTGELPHYEYSCPVVLLLANVSPKMVAVRKGFIPGTRYVISQCN